MNVLVLNCGSSSIKYQLLDGTNTLASGLLERIGEETGTLTHNSYENEDHYPDHETGLRAILKAFEDHGPSLTDVVAIGHRVVHGGDRFSDPVLIDDAVEKAIDELTPLAPLHNPANLEGIRVARGAFPQLPHVAVFDTAFHQTLPPHAYTYAVPRSWADMGVRRYGFHGTSCAYVYRRAAALLEKPFPDIIVLHLGNGASATAVSEGRSVDTSMGLTPLEGLVMGSRSGDVDPALPAYLSRVAGLSLLEIDAALNKHSGMVGLAGAGDLREVWRRAGAGDAQAAEALDIYCHRIRKYVGAYYAVLGNVDAIVFTAGVGENDPRIRSRALANLDRLGIKLDPARNESPSRAERVISAPDADVTVLVIPTNEELEIATQALAVTNPA
ncbi:acetate/propionate family kinase [Actinomadura sp. 6N118]|uniref:acetate/propionate family kinase n=1 Tax=Actinomadura sp. 6N118 TaxID=3375151 RepID=UPI00379961FE